MALMEEEGAVFMPEGGDGVVEGDGDEEEETWRIVGRFLTQKMVKLDFMRQVLASVWQPVRGVQVTEIQRGLFLFVFFHKTDVEYVLNGGPWAFENNALVCREVLDGVNPVDVELDMIDMWVQLHDMPKGYTSHAILEQAGNFLGSFVKHDDRFEGAPWLTFHRIRVSISVDRPLRRRMRLMKRDGTTAWVNFRYERLHKFCYFCGCMGHLHTFCIHAREAGIPVERYLYGPDLRAGGSRSAPRAVGDSWLVPVGGKPRPLGVKPRVVDGGQGSGGVTPTSMSEDEVVVATAKRRRHGTEGGEDDGNDEIVGLASSKKPDFVFLMETKVPRIHAERIRVTLGYEGLFYVDNDALSGGMTLLWKKNNTVRLLSYSQSHIDVEVSLFNKIWRMTCIYGIPERSRREETWDLLGTLKTRSLLPWVVIGDFNNLLYQHEKKGGNPYPNSLLRGFGDAVDDCGLVQMPMRGHQYTWQKGKGTPNWIEERLDKALITNDWGLLNENACLENIRTRASDHSILFLSINAFCMPRRRGSRKFRFEMAWLLDEGCKEVVQTAWQEGRTEGLLHCQQLCGEKLMQWGGDQFHRFGKRINHLQRRQDAIRNRQDMVALVEYQQIENTMRRVEAQEDVKKIFISTIKCDAGNWVEGDYMHAAIQNYFENIFASNGLSCDDPLFGVLTPRVTLEQNMMLDRPFETNEVKEALFSMYPDKAPGPDGLNPGFYQQFWEIVGGHVSGFIMNALNSCVFPEGLNDTNIVLVPKKEMHEIVADLRPIALSNVVYRIMAKMIANRMKTLMGGLISESQSAFIPGRLITDNILVAAEVGHYLNRKQCGVVGWSALKLDMSNAYDRMEWSFLERMLTVMGFSEKWIKLIIMCVTTVNYTVMVNGIAGGM
ncbi:PREDICTED: uncharacterized protein LOC109180221 [Ipomoea nil]|uniref:uncharacterized protein LOC109180221 n=1 Tax=Ipomoea nil TaxID=35883 RepID=UPI000901D05F|nr:PREDICTED: uncharacterized protein LOC109180221 [Ipomoea nil]